ncbi:hypothetical protein INS49_009368 [Diaporthe citri]|uniref:uncharacterized protein n=1 Tax=Diaporthe citri TaxID=83186 RepID=UPI001C814BA0|nr:uncharacterized protein INS49_009368 [Diaporthe citri]KAG6361144.1 hypothetical protein INS49_009368 [Diaporthe citri]
MARINKHLEKSKLPPMSLDDNVDWDGVKSQVGKACGVLEKILLKKKKRPGLVGSIRRGFDKLCRNAGTGKAFVSIIPQDLMIASAVSGGLKIIFVALEQHGIYEESVFNALEGLPDILNTTGRYSQIVVTDEEIHRLTAQFYTRVCEVLDYILRWMMDSVLLSGAKQMFKGNRYEKDLSDKMAEVRLAAQTLEKWASTLLLQSQENMSNMQAQMYLQLGYRLESFENKVEHKLDSIFNELPSKIERSNTFELVAPMVFNSCKLVLNEEWNRINRSQTICKSIENKPVPSKTTAEEVLDQLLFDPGLVPRDMEDLLRQGTATLHQKIQPDRLQAIQDNPRIRAWLSLDSPSLLLVNGNSPSHLDLSTSFVSAKIMNTLMRQAPKPHKNIEIISLAYFCVKHQNYSRDEAAHPAELAMSLLLQLVHSHRDFEPNLLQKCLDERLPYNIKPILECLAELLDGLPLEAVVFVIIDGIEHFTRPNKRRRGLREVCFQLIQVFREQRGAKVKLLFTSAQKAVMLEELGLLMDDEIVNIPKSPPPKGQPNQRNMSIEL